jgi:hypothetical protein
MPIDAPESEETKSAIIVERRVTLLFNAPTHVLVLLWHHHLLQHHHPTCKPKERMKCIRKVEDGYDLDLDYYYMEDWLLEDASHDWVIKLGF